jgi:hypothetical protein
MNSGCPICHKPGISQKKLKNILHTIFPAQLINYDYYGFDWLRNPKTNRKLELDIYIPHLKLAIEYDGLHHFEQRIGWSSFRDTKYRDKIKNKLLAQHFDDIKYFIRIPYWEPLTEENIKKILIKNNIII